MKRLALLAIFSMLSLSVFAQKYIKNNYHDNGSHIIDTYPSMFAHQTEQYFLGWNYISTETTEMYYLTVLCNDQVAPWYVKPGDKAFIRLLNQEDYHEITALLDAEPEEYTSTDGTKKYRTIVSYMIPTSLYESLYKGFDRFLLKVKIFFEYLQKYLYLV